MTVIVLADGSRFVPQQWHDAEIGIIPRHNEALATCRACGFMVLVPEEKIRTERNSQRSISDVAARLRCSSCGAKDADLQFGYLGGDPPPL